MRVDVGRIAVQYPCRYCRSFEVSALTAENRSEMTLRRRIVGGHRAGLR